MEFIAHVASSYPILWVDTCEYERAIYDLSNEIRNTIHHNVFAWDVVDGLKANQKGQFVPEKCDDADDPLTPIHFLAKAKQPTVLFAEDYHLFLKSPEVWRTLLNNIHNFKSSSNIFVIVSPVVDIPQEIKRYITVIDYSLPTKEDIGKILDKITTDMNINDLDETERKEIINSGTGLTAFEFENAVYHSIVLNKQKIVPASIHQQKRQLIRKNAAMDVVKSQYGFERIAGLDNMKDFVPRMVGKPGARGIMIVGVPGGGKSAFAKALGKETGRMTIELDIGNLQGGIVGETEQNTKDALQTIDAMEPAILFLDELEKSLSGVSGYSGDSGASKRQGGQVLKWLNDHTSDVYVIATCNNIDELPAEYLRSGRWDAIFYVGLPSADERKKLVNLYKNIYGLEDTELPNISNWTGAEIETLCKLAKNLNVPLTTAAKYVCPIVRTSADKIKNMQEKVRGIAVSASNEPEQVEEQSTGRKIVSL